jgi:hypothetical protein
MGMQLLAFAATLAALVSLSRWISRQVQVIGLRLTRNEQVTLLAYYLLMLPGILLHELSHVAAARLLGLRVGKLALGPHKRGRYIELGSVQVGSGGPVRDSLVGLAPFLAGTAVLLAVGYLVFDVQQLGLAWQKDGWGQLLEVAGRMSRVPDFWLWAYLVFAVSNAMTPSPADRQPWLIASIYLGCALVLAYLLGGSAPVWASMPAQVAGAVQMLTLAFLLTLAMDLVVAVALLAMEGVILQLQRPRN